MFFNVPGASSGDLPVMYLPAPSGSKPNGSNVPGRTGDANILYPLIRLDAREHQTSGTNQVLGQSSVFSAGKYSTIIYHKLTHPWLDYYPNSKFWNTEHMALRQRLPMASLCHMVGVSREFAWLNVRRLNLELKLPHSEYLSRRCQGGHLRVGLVSA